MRSARGDDRTPDPRRRPTPARVIGAAACLLAAAGLAVGAEPRADPQLEVATAAGLTAERFHVLDPQIGALIDTLLADNPRLGSAWTRSMSSFERVPQERSLPDPVLSYRYFARTPETRVGPQEHQLELSQTVPWAAKRRLQGERAERSAAAQTWEAEDLERRAVAELKRAYFESAYLQEALRVNAEERELLARFESIALRRYATGQGIQQSVVKVQTEISRLEDRETDLRQRLETLARTIAELIGRPEAPLALHSIHLPFPDPAYGRAALEERAVLEHPRVSALEQKIAAGRLWTRRRELDSKPDFRVGLGFTAVGRRDDRAGELNPPEDNGQDTLALTVGVNVPVHRQRIRSGVAEAARTEQADRELLAAVRNGLRFQIQAAALRLDSLSERGRLYLEVIIPQAEESLASAEAAYTTDRSGFLDLLDAERILFQSRLAYHRLVADLWITLADLELAAARRFPAAGGGPGDRPGSDTEPAR